MKPFVPRVLRQLQFFFRKYLVGTTALLILLYLFAFQNEFMRTGDAWAEGLTEYLGEALRLGWGEVFMPSWMGYLTLLPSLLSKAYVAVGMPLGYIDLFYRAVSVVFVVVCTSFMAHRMHRKVIRSDVARIALALCMVVLVADVSTFAFINVWYVGFAPIILLCLNSQKLGKVAQVLYMSAAALIALSKPSIILIPFVLYRAWRTREYTSNGLVLAAVGVQTYMLMRVNSGPAETNIGHILTVTGTQALKLFHVVPGEAWCLAAANAVLALIALVLWLTRGIWVAMLMAFGALFAAYSYYVAAGSDLFRQGATFRDVYQYDFKAQQELVVAIFLVISIFLAGTGVYQYARKRSAKKYVPLLAGVFIIFAAGVAVRIYQPIDAHKTVSISSFRHSLNTKQPTCIPLPARSPAGPDVNWMFPYLGKCQVESAMSLPDYSRFTVPLTGNESRLSVYGVYGRPITAMLIPIKTDTPVTLTLRDTVANMSFTSTVKPMKNGYGFASFNVTGLPWRGSFTFTLSADKLGASLSYFTDSDSIALYPYFISE
jgi:hypothetical protein